MSAPPGTMALQRRTGGIMAHVVAVTRAELLERRNDILRQLGTDLPTFAARAKAFSLVGKEWDTWDELENIAFLLGDDEL